MRFLTAFILSVLLVFASAARPIGEDIYVSATTQNLAAWTPKNWKEREKFLSLPGVYTKCGNYLFTFTPVIVVTKAPAMLGFGIAKKGGDIASVTVVDARGGRVRIWESPKGSSPSVKLLNNNPSPEGSGYLIILPPDEYASVLECLNVKRPESNEPFPKQTII